LTKLFVEYTDYSYSPPVDISIFRVHQWSNPLIVCAREQQKTRLRAMQELGLIRKSVSIKGWWDMNGSIDSLFEYDAIFVLDPERIGEPAANDQWRRVIECLK